MKATRLARPSMRVALVLLALLVAGCASPSPEPADVLATFYPLAFAAERLGGGDLRVGTLVPAGVEPHDWEASAQDVARLDRARVMLAQGAGFEPWLQPLLANLGEDAPPLVVTTEGLALANRERQEGGEEASAVDPHTWLDPQLYRQQVAAVERALIAAWPEHAEGIRARAAALSAELDALHREHEVGLATCDARVVIANHDAYGYLARAYGFELVAISGLSPEAEPSPDAIARAVDVAREHDLEIVFFEELVSPRVAEVVAEEVGAQTRVLSPIEGRPPEGDYLTLMRQNLANLREAMRCT